MTNPTRSDNPLAKDGYPLRLRALIEILFGDQLQSFAIDLTDSGLVLKGFCGSVRVKQMVEKVIGQIVAERIASNELVVRDVLSGFEEHSSPPRPPVDSSSASGDEPVTA